MPKVLRLLRNLLIATYSVVLLLAASGGIAQSLGDVARAQKEKQTQGTKKTAKVYTNGDFPSGNAEPEQPTPASPTALSETSLPEPVPTVRADTPDGGSVALSPDRWTDLIFMATWCPHSQALKDFLNDPQARPYWAKKKLVFLFSKNEWGREKADLQDLAKSGKISESAIPGLLEQMKRKAGSPYVLHPTFLDDIPGDYYFCAIPKEVKGYPEVLSARGYVDRAVWLTQDLRIPSELYEKFRTQYDSGH